MKKDIYVVGEVIVSEGSILCARRGPGGFLAQKWEFPGGKIEAGETPREALEREIEEELCCTVQVVSEVTTTRHEDEFGIVNLSTFWCELVAGTPQLTEHSAVEWLPPEELKSLDWAPADVPAVNLVRAESK